MELSQQDLELLEKTLPGCAALYSLNGDRVETLWISDSIPALNGLTREEYDKMTGENAAAIVYPDDLPALMETVRQCVLSRGSFECYYRVFHKQRGIDWTHAGAKYCGEFGGRPLLSAVYANASLETDIYQRIIDNTGRRIYVYDCDTYEILFANKAAREFRHGGGEQYAGRKCYEYLFGRSAPCGDCYMQQMLRGDHAAADRYRADKDAWEHLTGSFSNWCGHTAFIHYADDVTEARARQKELQNLVDSHECQLQATRILNEELPIDERMNRTMQAMLEYYEADRTYVFLVDEGGKTESNLYERCREGVQPEIDTLQKMDIHLIDRWMALFAHREVVSQSDIETIRESDPVEYAVMSRQGIRSYMEAPIIASGRFIGFIGADNPAAAKMAHTGDLLLSFAYSVGDAILKEQSAEKLRRHSDELEAIVNNIPVGISMIRVRNGKAVSKLVNPLLCELYGITREQSGDADQIAMSRIREPYRSQVRENMARLLTPGTSVRLEFPYLLTDGGEPRWYQMNARSVAYGEELLYFSCLSDMTAEKTAQRELLSSQRRYQLAVDGAGLGVWEYDIANHRITSPSGSFRKFGVPDVIENVPASILPLLRQDDRPRLTEMFRRIEQGDPRVEDYFWMRWREDIPLRCEHVIYSVARDADGRPSVAYGIGMDATMQKNAEEQYERELAELRSTDAVNLIAKGRHNLSKNSIIEYVPMNKKAFNIPAGLTYDDACAAFVRMPVNDDDKKALAALISRENLIRAFRAGETHFTFRYARSKEQLGMRWVTTVINTYESPSNGDVECFMYSYDTTENMLREHILGKLSEFGFVEIGLIDTATQICTSYLTGAQGPAPAAESISPYGEKTKKYAADMAPPAQPQSAVRALSLANILETLSREEAFIYTASIRDGARIRRDRIVFSWLDDRRETVFYCRSDITKDVEKEEQRIFELSAAKLEADRANEAKSAFLSSMSHDIRTPLNGIIGFTDIALRETEPAKKQAYLEKIRASGDILINLVNDTLELSRIESGKVAPEYDAVPAQECTVAVVDALRPAAELKGVRLVTELPQNVGMIWMDKLKLQKILLNLLSNAIKFTPPGGTVTVSAGMIDPPENGRNRRITVEDTGIGISPAFLPQIYEPFSQEHSGENVSGTGLGLSIVKRYVDMLGGTICAKSEPGKGTRFIVDLPIRILGPGAPGPQKDGARAQDDLSLLSGRRVLLCEDNAINTEIALLLLREKGVAADCAKNGREAVEMFRTSPVDRYGAILMDIRMPVMNGYDAARAIRALDRPDAARVPILAMTADAFEESVLASKEAGMDGHIAKPIDSAQFYRTLAAQFRKGAKQNS
ncbi:MAG: ATP-binding protein [Oscillospiraceae bacterium]|nr:ATP-binding protein [Oscillospiraceae bacterium]